MRLNSVLAIGGLAVAAYLVITFFGRRRSGYDQPPRDVKISIATDRSQYYLQEPIPLKISILNCENQPVECDYWEQGSYPYTFNAYDESGFALPFTEYGKAYAIRVSIPRTTYGGSAPFTHEIEPGKIIRDTVLISQYVDLSNMPFKDDRPYKVCLQIARYGQLSNVVPITISPKSGKDKN